MLVGTLSIYLSYRTVCISFGYAFTAYLELLALNERVVSQYDLLDLALKVGFSYGKLYRFGYLVKLFNREALRNAYYERRYVVFVSKETYCITAGSFELALGNDGIYIFSVFAYDQIVDTSLDEISSVTLLDDVLVGYVRFLAYYDFVRH